MQYLPEMPMTLGGKETRPIMPARNLEREFEMQNRERVQMLLRQTERALARLEDGTYG